LKNFNKMHQLISTLTRTFYKASAAAEDGAVNVRSGPFRHLAILRARAAGGSEQDKPGGHLSTQIERVTF
jgi:hypothetical protein